ncbi:MAG: GEVED domain-containing protein [Thermoguttaceae bacterium]
MRFWDSIFGNSDSSNSGKTENSEQKGKKGGSRGLFAPNKAKSNLTNRQLQMEQFEVREMLSIGGPQLNTIFVNQDENQAIDLKSTMNIAPTSLLFRFSEGQQIDTKTLTTGIEVYRAGTKTPVPIGSVELGDFSNEVIVRFAENLPNDMYTISLIGGDTNSLSLKNLDGKAFYNPDGPDYDLQNVKFELQLGAQVTAVVPQPVVRNTSGGLEQQSNVIEVYFTPETVLKNAGDAKFYQLIVTKNTLNPGDDVVVVPTRVVYEPGVTVDGKVVNRAKLYFEKDDTGTAITNLSALGTGSFRLRIGEEYIATNTQILDLTGQNEKVGDTFHTAYNVNLNLFNTAQSGPQSLIIQSEIERQYDPTEYPGANDNPGHRSLPNFFGDSTENHFFGGESVMGYNRDVYDGPSIIYYNFQYILGSVLDSKGNPTSAKYYNNITETQKNLARQALDMYSRYLGIQFIETADQGFTIAMGDMAWLGPGRDVEGVDSHKYVFDDGTWRYKLIGEYDPSLLMSDYDPSTFSSSIVLDQNYTWGPDVYGGNWFQTVVRGIGFGIGLGYAADLMPGTDMRFGVIPVQDGNGYNMYTEKVYPGLEDLIHGQYLFRPDSIDVDMYKFQLEKGGTFSAEILAERANAASQLDATIALYRQITKRTPDGQTYTSYELVSRNDDYFSNDSFLEMYLEAGTYFIGVSSSGNDQYDPQMTGTGEGGKTVGTYELRLNFSPSGTERLAPETFKDETNGFLAGKDTNVKFDGNQDGVPGGTYNYWFNVQQSTNQPAQSNNATNLNTINRVLYVDNSGRQYNADGTPKSIDPNKLRLATEVGDGTIAKPFVTIEVALEFAAKAQQLLEAAGIKDSSVIVRIIGNDLSKVTKDTDIKAYEIGKNPNNNANLTDGAKFDVPKGVSVVIDAGVVIKMNGANITVGSSDQNIDRSGGSIQLLGTPVHSVRITSYMDQMIGVKTNPQKTEGAPGNWGGIVIRNDLDYEFIKNYNPANGRTPREVLETQGIFLNYVSNADIRYGGGTISTTDRTIYDPIHVVDARPTITFSTIQYSAHAAISASPKSFEETRFQSWDHLNPYTLDYERIGLHIHGNIVTLNSMNGLLVQVQTQVGKPIQKIEVAARFDDTDIVHILSENLILAGQAGGNYLSAPTSRGLYYNQVTQRVAIDVTLGTVKAPTRPQDGDYFTLVDGETSVTFEYNHVDYDSVTNPNRVVKGRIAIDIYSSDTPAEIARKTVLAINAVNSNQEVYEKIGATNYAKYLLANQKLTPNQFKITAEQDGSGFYLKSTGQRLEIKGMCSGTAPTVGGLTFNQNNNQMLVDVGSTQSPTRPGDGDFFTLLYGDIASVTFEYQYVDASGQRIVADNPNRKVFADRVVIGILATDSAEVIAQKTAHAISSVYRIAKYPLFAVQAEYSANGKGFTLKTDGLPVFTDGVKDGTVTTTTGLTFNPVDNVIHIDYSLSNPVRPKDGDFFSIEYEGKTYTFEYNWTNLTGNGWGVRPGNIAININGATALAADIATATRNAINRTIFQSNNNNLRAEGIGAEIRLVSPSSPFAIEGIRGQLQNGEVNITNPGGVAGMIKSRTNGSLVVDPGIVTKSNNARIELEMGTQLLAEGTVDQPIIFTSLYDTRFGAGGTFKTSSKSGGTAVGVLQPGNWAGIIQLPDSHLSIDHAVLAYAGGSSVIEGLSARFNPVEIHEADSRLAHTRFEFNAGNTAGTRTGRGSITPAVIYVHGSQPIILNNSFFTNLYSDIPTNTPASQWIPKNDAANGLAVISINSNALNAKAQKDSGRNTAGVARNTQYDDNYGPLVRENRLSNNTVNGMVVRGEVLTTESVWDDTDIAHVLFTEIIVPNFHHEGGLRLMSDRANSLVIKMLGSKAGFTASGTPLEIEDRIGGAIQIVGVANYPVVFTSLKDDSVGTGLDIRGQVQYDTNNTYHYNATLKKWVDNSVAMPGDWRSIKLAQYSNDRNILVVKEFERSNDEKDSNGTTSSAQYLGYLAQNMKSGDDVQRLGFTVYGSTRQSAPNEADVYKFTADAGTEIWVDIDRTGRWFDTIIEILDQDGKIVASSDNSFYEGVDNYGNYINRVYDKYGNVQDSGTTSGFNGANNAFSMNKDAWNRSQTGIAGVSRNVLNSTDRDTNRLEFDETDGIGYNDLYSTNTRDAGLRFVTAGPGTKDYFVRVRSVLSISWANSLDPVIDQGKSFFIMDENKANPQKIEYILDFNKTWEESSAVRSTQAGATNKVTIGLKDIDPEFGDTYASRIVAAINKFSKTANEYLNVAADLVSSRLNDPNPIIRIDGTGLFFNPGATSLVLQENSSGTYELQVRLQEQNEIAGSQISYADIRYATNGIEAYGFPQHSPITGEVQFRDKVEILNGMQVSYMGNLLQSNQGSLSAAGYLQSLTDVNWYAFNMNPAGLSEYYGYSFLWPSIFDIDYADGLTRPDLSIWVFDRVGSLIYMGTDSNVADDRPGPNTDINISKLGSGTVGPNDPFIGPALLGESVLAGYLPEGTEGAPVGTYFVAVTSKYVIPYAMSSFLTASPYNSSTRIEPIDTITRVVDEGVQSGQDLRANNNRGYTSESEKFEEGQRLVLTPDEFHLGDVVMYVTMDDPGTGESKIYMINPATGAVQTVANTGQSAWGYDATRVGYDISMAYDSRLLTTFTELNHLYLVDVNTGNYASSDWRGTNTLIQSHWWGQGGIEAVPDSVGTATSLRVQAIASSAPGDFIRDWNSKYGPYVSDWAYTLVVGDMSYGTLVNDPDATSIPETYTSNENVLYLLDPYGKAVGITEYLKNWNYGAGDKVRPLSNYIPIATFNNRDTVKYDREYYYVDPEDPVYRDPLNPGGYAYDAEKGEWSTERSDDATGWIFDFFSVGVPNQFQNVGEVITGMTFDSDGGNLYVGTDRGGIYRVKGWSSNPGGFPDDGKSYGYMPLAEDVPEVVITTKGTWFEDYSYVDAKTGERIRVTGSGGPSLEFVGYLLDDAGNPLSVSGLDLGPQTVENAAYKQTIFATVTNTDSGASQIVAFDPKKLDASDLRGLPVSTAGPNARPTFLEPIFYNGSKAITIPGNITGLTFSKVDYNLWHRTQVDSDVKPPTPSTIRPAGQYGTLGEAQQVGASLTDAKYLPGNGASWYFGLEMPNPLIVDGQPNANWMTSGINQFGPDRSGYKPAANIDPADPWITPGPSDTGGTRVGSYDMPGGAYGSLTSNAFDLTDYCAEDKPMIYFSYKMDGDESDPLGNALQYGDDTIMVYVTADGYNWERVAASSYELISHPTNPTDPTNYTSLAGDNRWRQARLDLSRYAGKTDVKVKFVFSTAGGQVGLGKIDEAGTLFTAVPASRLFDTRGQVVSDTRPVILPDGSHEDYFPSVGVTGLNQQHPNLQSDSAFVLGEYNNLLVPFTSLTTPAGLASTVTYRYAQGFSMFVPSTPGAQNRGSLTDSIRIESSQGYVVTISYSDLVNGDLNTLRSLSTEEFMGRLIDEINRRFAMQDTSEQVTASRYTVYGGAVSKLNPYYGQEIYFENVKTISTTNANLVITGSGSSGTTSADITDDNILQRLSQMSVNELLHWLNANSSKMASVDRLNAYVPVPIRGDMTSEEVAASVTFMVNLTMNDDLKAYLATYPSADTGSGWKALDQFFDFGYKTYSGDYVPGTLYNMQFGDWARDQYGNLDPRMLTTLYGTSGVLNEQGQPLELFGLTRDGDAADGSNGRTVIQKGDGERAYRNANGDVVRGNGDLVTDTRILSNVFVPANKNTMQRTMRLDVTRNMNMDYGAVGSGTTAQMTLVGKGTLWYQDDTPFDITELQRQVYANDVKEFKAGGMSAFPRELQGANPEERLASVFWYGEENEYGKYWNNTLYDASKDNVVRRGNDNVHGGIFIDNIIVGAAGRGEMVSNAVPGNTGFLSLANPLSDPAIKKIVEDISARTGQDVSGVIERYIKFRVPVDTVQSGAYELNIRRGAETVSYIPSSGNSPYPLELMEIRNLSYNRATPISPIHVNERLTNGITIATPLVSEVYHGQKFSISDGVNKVDFCFLSDELVGSTGGAEKILFSSNDTVETLAKKIVEAINKAYAVKKINVSASPFTNGNLIDLFDAVDFKNGGLLPVPNHDTDSEEYKAWYIQNGEGGKPIKHIIYGPIYATPEYTYNGSFETYNVDQVMYSRSLQEFLSKDCYASRLYIDPQMGNARVGDTNVERPKGQLVITGTSITASAQAGLVLLPLELSALRPGVVPQLNQVMNSQLPVIDSAGNAIVGANYVPGIAITNNIFAGNPVGIAIGGVEGNVPFARIVNNTFFGIPTEVPGGVLWAGIGIAVGPDASPTIMNNIFAYLDTGISLVDSEMKPIDLQVGTVEEVVALANVFKNNRVNQPAINGRYGTFGNNEYDKMLGENDPLFVMNIYSLFDPETGHLDMSRLNFYLDKDSPAIDTARETLLEREEWYSRYISRLGIPRSTIYAPNTDIYGQTRVADTGTNSSGGGGSNPYVDMGAIDRVDKVPPRATLLKPLDNDDAGIDRNRELGDVVLIDEILNQFIVQLSDVGTGLDRASIANARGKVHSNIVTVYEQVWNVDTQSMEVRKLVQDVDYFADYNSANDQIFLTPTKGRWSNTATYTILLDNDAIPDWSLEVPDIMALIRSGEDVHFWIDGQKFTLDMQGVTSFAIFQQRVMQVIADVNAAQIPSVTINGVDPQYLALIPEQYRYVQAVPKMVGTTPVGISFIQAPYVHCDSFDVEVVKEYGTTVEEAIRGITIPGVEVLLNGIRDRAGNSLLMNRPNGQTYFTVVMTGYDYGDALPASYDLVNGVLDPARHIVYTGYNLGKGVTVEPYPLRSDHRIGPDGKQVHGDRYDDGVELDVLVPGKTIDVSIYITSKNEAFSEVNSIVGYVNAFFDWDQSGSWDVAQDERMEWLDETTGNWSRGAVPVKAGQNTIKMRVPTTTKSGAIIQEGEIFARFRFSSTGRDAAGMQLGPNGLTADGEVEDYKFLVASHPKSYGDAPQGRYLDPYTGQYVEYKYPVTKDSGGAWHATDLKYGVNKTTNKAEVIDATKEESAYTKIAGLHFGPLAPLAHLDAQMNADATMNKTDDGVASLMYKENAQAGRNTTIFISGKATTLNVEITIPAALIQYMQENPTARVYFSSWFDFLGEHDWTNNSVSVSRTLSFSDIQGLTRIVGTDRYVLPISVNVPAGFTEDRVSFARFRVSSSPILGPGGPGAGEAAIDGEVEDYMIFISKEQTNHPVSSQVQAPSGDTEESQLPQEGAISGKDATHTVVMTGGTPNQPVMLGKNIVWWFDREKFPDVMDSWVKGDLNGNDGVELPSVTVGNKTYENVIYAGEGKETVATVQPTKAGRVSVWIDWNGDGIYSADERVVNPATGNNWFEVDPTNPSSCRLSIPGFDLGSRASFETKALFRYTLSGDHTGLDAYNHAMSGEAEEYTVTIVNGRSSITGMVYNDMNGNGTHEPYEPGIAGVEVWLWDNATKQGNPVMVTWTDRLGNYTFPMLYPGEYWVEQREILLQEGEKKWTPTEPRDNQGKPVKVYHVEGLDDGEERERVNFGNYKPGVVSVGNATVVEGNSGYTYVDVDVYMTGSIGAQTEITLTTGDGTAFAGLDYVGETQKVVFSGNETLEAAWNVRQITSNLGVEMGQYDLAISGGSLSYVTKIGSTWQVMVESLDDPNGSFMLTNSARDSIASQVVEVTKKDANGKILVDEQGRVVREVHVVWLTYNGTGYDLYYSFGSVYDLRTLQQNIHKLKTEDNLSASDPQISKGADGRVYTSWYTKDAGGHCKLFVFEPSAANLSNGVGAVVVPAGNPAVYSGSLPYSGKVSEVKMDGSTIAWTTTDSKVYVSTVVNGIRETRLISANETGTVSNQRIQLCDGLVVWEHQVVQSNQKTENIAIYNVEKAARVYITQGSAKDSAFSSPTVNQYWVAFEHKTESGYYDIYAVSVDSIDWSAGTQSLDKLGTQLISQKTGTKQHDDVAPQLSGDRIVWRSAVLGTNSWAVYTVDLREAGLGYQQVSTVQYYAWNPVVSDRRIVWRAPAGQNYVMYSAEYLGRMVKQTVRFRVIGETLVEPNEYFMVTITGATLVGTGKIDIDPQDIIDSSKNTGVIWIINDDGNMDFGDLPASYGTLLKDDGARHLVSATNPLAMYNPNKPGVTVDTEKEGVPSSDAKGDDLNNSKGNDEQGVVFVNEWKPGQEVTVEIYVNEDCYLNAFADWNLNGQFGTRNLGSIQSRYLSDTIDRNERLEMLPDFKAIAENGLISRNETGLGCALKAGKNTITFTVPRDAKVGNTYARFRVSSEGGLSFSGQAFDGEIEDYRVTVVASSFEPVRYDARTQTVHVEGSLLSDTTTIKRVDMSGKLEITHNGTRYTFDPKDKPVQAISYNGMYGSNTVTFMGLAEDAEEVILRPYVIEEGVSLSRGEIKGTGLTVSLVNARNVNFDGGVGTSTIPALVDSVIMYDSPDSDVLQMFPDKTSFSGSTFKYLVQNVDYATVMSENGGYDECWLYGQGKAGNELYLSNTMVALWNDNVDGKGRAFGEYVYGFKGVHVDNGAGANGKAVVDGTETNFVDLTFRRGYLSSPHLLAGTMIQGTQRDGLSVNFDVFGFTQQSVYANVNATDSQSIALIAGTIEQEWLVGRRVQDSHYTSNQTVDSLKLLSLNAKDLEEDAILELLAFDHVTAKAVAGKPGATSLRDIKTLDVNLVFEGPWKDATFPLVD